VEVGREVTDIRVENGAVSGIGIDGEAVSAPVVVSNADATRTLLTLVGEENLPTSYVRKLTRLQPGLSAFSVYAATTLDLRALGATH